MKSRTNSINAYKNKRGLAALSGEHHVVKRILAACAAVICMAGAHAENIAPTVSIAGPANNASFVAPGQITITADAVDSDGTISRVTYYRDGVLLNSATVAPYRVTWMSVPAGTYSITARALDNSGAVTTSAPVTVVVNPNVAPTVALTSPAANTSFVAPAATVLTATAADSDGVVKYVSYYRGETLINTATVAPYTINWNNIPAGSYTVTARAADDKGVVTSSAPVEVVVHPNVAPTVAITGPADNSSFAGPGMITLTVNAADSDGTVSKVEYYKGSVIVGTVYSAPFTLNWNGVATGSYVVTARATDNKGAVTISAPITIAVNPNVAPAVAITSPASGATATTPGTIALTVAASDSDGSVTKVSYYHSQTVLIGTATAAPFTVNWVNPAAGNYNIYARATDDKGAGTSSAMMNMTVKANVAPTVSLAASALNQAYVAPAVITLTANAADSDGNVAKVELYNGTELIGTATTAPYAFTWNGVAAGSYVLTAKVTDNSGGTSVSAPVNVTVAANAAPVVSLTATPSNAVAPATIALGASAIDSDGTVARVEFYNGDALLATVAQAPYEFSWTNVSAGNYAITAKATDNLGAATTSAIAQVTVTGDGPQVYYIYSDQVNTAREITNASGTTVWRADTTEPFGANLPDENPVGQGQFTYNPRYPGQYFDKETGLHYNYHRDYDPQTGRYVQSDPIGLAGGINTYGYVGGNPISLADPLGLVNPGTAAGAGLGTAIFPGPGTIVGGIIGTGLGAWGIYEFTRPDAPAMPATSRPPRPSDMTRMEERHFDRNCANSDDPCRAIKAAVMTAIAGARGKMEKMYNDKTLFQHAHSTPNPAVTGTNTTWTGHIDDLNGRTNNIWAMITLGRKMGCDMSAETAAAMTVHTPGAPRG